MTQISRPCDGCGRDVPRAKPTGSIPRYCSEQCKPRCSVDGCTEAVRKRGWCVGHYGQWTRTGKPPVAFKYRWSDWQPCKVCGNPPGNGSRVFCSDACAFLWRKFNGEVPDHRTCIGCATRIELARNGTRRINSTVKFCRRCAQDYDKYKMTAAQLADRDGTDCGICGLPVDMTLRRKDEGGHMCPSVDHILPRALGGTHEPDNLQLAHLHCNQVKSDRVAGVA